jgi:hypothetical protein
MSNEVPRPAGGLEPKTKPPPPPDAVEPPTKLNAGAVACGWKCGADCCHGDGPAVLAAPHENVGVAAGKGPVLDAATRTGKARCDPLKPTHILTTAVPVTTSGLGYK